LCTHDLDEAERVADQVAIMRQGQIVARDAPAVLRAQAEAGTLVRVELAGPCPAALVALQDFAGLAELRASENGLAYCTEKPQAVNPQVVALLVATGAQVVSITCHSPSLEDVYASAMTAQSDTPAMPERVP
jgi:ABC-2 type transport system ATP-binding protein